ncbi:MAG: Rho termination factor N-terminal domain-containing protein, partial [Phenylobacterium sp.]|nr:Rho termination factor N-terminal domain-containing protein [Phenylobacterium sp.]
MSEDTETQVLENQTDEDGGADNDLDEPSLASPAIAAMGLTKMSLQELKEKSSSDRLACAEQMDIENANSMRKQDMMFGILKTLA